MKPLMPGQGLSTHATELERGTKVVEAKDDEEAQDVLREVAFQRNADLSRLQQKPRTFNLSMARKRLSMVLAWGGLKKDTNLHEKFGPGEDLEKEDTIIEEDEEDEEASSTTTSQ